ncbi:11296_t:CDS:2, partial [Acaulospora colombiana]
MESHKYSGKPLTVKSTELSVSWTIQAEKPMDEAANNERNWDFDVADGTAKTRLKGINEQAMRLVLQPFKHL